MSTSGMYLEGALLGAAFAALLFFALPRLNVVDRARRARRAWLERADLSLGIGPTTVSLDATGVFIRTPAREMRLSWDAVAPHSCGGHVVLQHGLEATIIPRRAFESDAAAEAFVSQARAWCEAGRLPPHERLARYLAEHDAWCTQCRYALRGLRDAKCPECGQAIEIPL